MASVLQQMLMAAYPVSAAAPTSDPYFKYVSLLLSGDTQVVGGDTYVDNTTLLDQSSNGYTVTKVANPGQGTFSPYSLTESWSARFNGTTDYLSVATDAAFDLSGGDWTMEAFANLYVATTGGTLIHANLTDTDGHGINLNASGQWVYTVNGTAAITGPTANIGLWQHVVAERIGGTTTLYVDGISAGTTATAPTAKNYSASIGARANGTNFLNGSVSSARIVKGTAVYNGTVAVPSTILTAVTGTSLLTLQSDTFVDGSSNVFTVTPTGTPTTSVANPMSQDGWSASFVAANVVTFPTNAAYALPGQFTLEAAIQWTAAPATGNVIGMAAANGLQISHDGANLIVSQSGGTVVISYAFAPVINDWYYIATTRNASNLVNLWINGVSVGSATSAISFAQQPFSIGGAGFQGAVSSTRLIKGACLYTATYTPSRVPLMATSLTSLLTANEGRWKDFSTLNAVATYTGIPLFQKVSPYRAALEYNYDLISGSMFCNTTADYATVTSPAALAFGTGDFTIELWVYPRNTNNNLLMPASGTNTWGVLVSANNFYWQENGANVFTTGAVPQGQWHHLAVSRVSGTLYRFVNGVLINSAANTYNHTGTPNRNFGPASGGNAPFYMSDLRITNTGLYNAAFTPPAKPMSVVTGTQLKVPFGRNVGVPDASRKNVLTTISGAKTSTLIKKYGSASLLFNGTTDYLRIPNTPAVDLSRGDWTVELWLNKAGNNANLSRIWCADGDSYDAMILNLTASGSLLLSSTTTSGTWNVVNATFGGALTNGQWYHVAIVRFGANIYAFLNGARTVMSTTCPAVLYNSVVANKVIGGQSGVPRMLNGNIDDFRITKFARYTAAFTPPAAPLPLK